MLYNIDIGAKCFFRASDLELVDQKKPTMGRKEIMLQLYELLRDIESGAVKVRVYPLNKRVTHEVISVPRERRFEKELEKVTGKRIENHSCYCLVFQDGADVSFQLSDGQMIVGVGIEPA